MTALHISDPGRHTTRLMLLILILLLGWTLRTHDIENRSLWADEGWTMLLSEGPGMGEVTRTLAADQHPPLFFMSFRLWRNAAGDTELAARYFSVLIGMIAVAGIYQLGRELYDPTTGVLAMLLLALSDLHIDLSQEVRHYSALLTLGVLSSLFYARWWRRSTRINRVGYVLTSTMLLYTHYLGGFVLIAQFIHMVLAARPRKRLFEATFLFGATCAGFLPWSAVVIDQNRLRWDNPLYYQNSLPNSTETYRAVREAVLGSHFGLMAGMALLGLVYLAYRRQATRERIARIRLRPIWPTLYLMIWIILMVGLTVIINESRPFLTVRNFILIVSPIAVLIGHGLTNLEPSARLMLIGVITVVSLTTVDARRQYPDWRAVTRNVTDYHLGDEPILMDVWVGDFPVRYYIDQQLGEDTPRLSLREYRDQYGGDFVPKLQEYLAGVEAFWLIYWGDEPMIDYGGLIEDPQGPTNTNVDFQLTATLSVDHFGTPLYSYRYDRLTDEVIAWFYDVGEYDRDSLPELSDEEPMLALRKSNVPESASPGETITATLWWTAEHIPSLEYSVSVFILDEDKQQVAQHDGPPLGGFSPTTMWQPGHLQYDAHRVLLPASLLPGTYELGLRVYFWQWAESPLLVKIDKDGAVLSYVPLGTLQVK